MEVNWNSVNLLQMYHILYTVIIMFLLIIFFKYYQQTKSKDAANFVKSGTIIDSCYGREQQTNSFVSDSITCI
jgi:preprotein translocase subunit SecY